MKNQTKRRIDPPKFKMQFVFQRETKELSKDTRCLILDKNGGFDIAVWNGKDWYDEASLRCCGGIGGKITEDVIGFAILD